MTSSSTVELYEYVKERLILLREFELFESMEIRWNLRMRSTAGRADLLNTKVELNHHLIPFGEEEIYKTLLHEVAHLLAWKRCRHRGHGIPWRNACKDLGIPGESVTHSLSLPKHVRKKKWSYHCTHCGVQVQRVRQAKVRAACLRCCKEFNGGKFDQRFLLQEIQLV